MRVSIEVVMNKEVGVFYINKFVARVLSKIKNGTADFYEKYMEYEYRNTVSRTDEYLIDAVKYVNQYHPEESDGLRVVTVYFDIESDDGGVESVKGEISECWG